MAHVSTYLNFLGNAEEVFNFYKSVFRTEFLSGISRWGDVPPQKDMPALSEADRNKVMLVALPVTAGHVLMGTDLLDIMDIPLIVGNNVHISIQLDTRKETKRLFEMLAKGGKVRNKLSDTIWGDYFGSCMDKYGIHWMVNCSEEV